MGYIKDTNMLLLLQLAIYFMLFVYTQHIADTLYELTSEDVVFIDTGYTSVSL